MSELHTLVAATLYGKDISLHDVLYFLKLHQKTDFLHDAINGILVSRAIAREGITVSDAELQQAADDFRRLRRLYKTTDTTLWLQKHHLSVYDLEKRLEYEIACQKLREKLMAGQVERYFAEHKAAFDTAKISHIVTDKEGMASEIFSQVTEEDADFATLARRHSLDQDTRDAGGYIGIVTRRALSPAVEAAIFGATAGAVVGPVRTATGYHVIHVHSIHPSELNPHTRSVLQDLLYDEWLQRERRQAQVNIGLMSLL